MLVRQARQGSVVLFDFLAPNLLAARRASTQTPSRASPATSKKTNHPRDTLITKDSRALFLSIQSQLPHVADVDRKEANGFNNAFAAARIFKRTADPLKVQEAWNRLFSMHKFETAVRPTHWKLLSEDLQLFLREASRPKQLAPVERWDSNQIRAVRQLSLSLVSRGEEEAFAMYLVAAIRRNDMEEVLDAFQEYTSMVAFEPLPQGEKTELSDLDLLEFDGEPSTPSQLEWDPTAAELPLPDPTRSQGTKGLDNTRAARTRIMLSILAAHWHRNDLLPAINAGITYAVGLDSKSLSVYALQFLAHIPNSKKSFKDFVHQVILARLAKQPSLLFSRIATLARSGQLVQLTALYNGMKEGLFGPDIFIALDENSVSPERPVAVHSGVWGAFITAFIKCKASQQAEELWDDMHKLGMQPPASAWTALINGYGNNRGTSKAYSAWVTMQQLKVKPEASTYRAIIHALFVDKQEGKAMQLFRQFQKEFPATDPQVIETYNSVLHLLHLTHCDESAAEEILGSMRAHGPKPDLTTYNVFITYHGRRGNFTRLAALTKEMEANDIKPSEFTYSSLLSALLRAGRQNAADMVLSLMLKNGVKPTVATYTTLMHFQLQEETIHGLDGAFALLQKMETDKDPALHPNVVTYTTLLATIHRGTWITPEVRTERTSQILRSMSERGIGFHRITYHILIPACLENPTEAGVAAAMSYYRSMMQSGVQVVNDTWYVILRKLYHRRNWDEADEVLKDMSASFGDRLPPKWLADLMSKIKNRVVRKGRY